mmetsp:Transcript_52167/g.156566  ORF Transcript_52167/g.156566 Transcript_52167/m.156566 type:complete len:223 (-) Transcript_52167:771-1439(-)
MHAPCRLIPSRNLFSQHLGFRQHLRAPFNRLKCWELWRNNSSKLVFQVHQCQEPANKATSCVSSPSCWSSSANKSSNSSASYSRGSSSYYRRSLLFNRRAPFNRLKCWELWRNNSSKLVFQVHQCQEPANKATSCVSSPSCWSSSANKSSNSSASYSRGSSSYYRRSLFCNRKKCYFCNSSNYNKNSEVLKRACRLRRWYPLSKCHSNINGNRTLFSSHQLI